MNPKGLLMDVKRFAIHDGPGIRTTLFLKGCSLRCIWCHNPEGISSKPQLAYYAHKCIGCGICATACTQNAHAFTETGHTLNREKCIACGTCEQLCPSEALHTSVGKWKWRRPMHWSQRTLLSTEPPAASPFPAASRFFRWILCMLCFGS